MRPEIRTRTAINRLEEDGIVRSILAPGCEETLPDAVENIRAVRDLTGGRRAPSLIDFRLLKSQTREAREYYAGPETAAVVTAAAILIDSPLSRALGNIFLGLNKPLIPTKLFTLEAEALAWLAAFR